jgi:hypothetical protein
VRWREVERGGERWREVEGAMIEGVRRNDDRGNHMYKYTARMRRVKKQLLLSSPFNFVL